MYRLTDTGRALLRERRQELDALEDEITGSVHELAQGIRDRVRSDARDLRDELRQAARDACRHARHAGRGGLGGEQERREHEHPEQCAPAWDTVAARELDQRLGRFCEEVGHVARESSLSETRLAAVVSILDDALISVQTVLRA